MFRTSTIAAIGAVIGTSVLTLGASFDDQGNLYVLEYASNFLQGDFSGALVQVAPDGTQQRFLQDVLVSPTAFEFGTEDDIYLANQGLVAGQGEVVRFDRSESVPEPTAILGLVAIALGGTALKLSKSQDSAAH